MYDTGDPKVQKALKAEENTKRSQDMADLEVVLGTVSGRRYLYRQIFLAGGLWSSCWHGDVRDGVCAARHDSYAQGFHDMALKIATEIRDEFPKQFKQMWNENFAGLLADAKPKGEIITSSAGD
jgi:hypothetical protein